MAHDVIVYTGEMEVEGRTLLVTVYSRPDGKHYAQTSLSENNIIINDGHSLADVLKVHSELLPLAVKAHEARDRYRGFRRR